jgi:hypothetical protein
MLRYTKIYGISHVDGPGPNGPRLWSQFILIGAQPTKEKRDSVFGDNRQIRGFTNGGLPVFTYWIHPDAEVSVEPVCGGAMKMIGCDGEAFNLDNGVKIVARWPNIEQAGKHELVLTAYAADHRNPKVTVEEIEVETAPHGPEVDEDILKSYQAPAYCVTAYVPKEKALAVSRELSGMVMAMELNRRLKAANQAAEESLERSRRERR